MKYFIKLSSSELLFFILLALFSSHAVAQTDKVQKLRLGINYGQASQADVPRNFPDYIYENWFLKLQINRNLKNFKHFDLELNVEPSIYFTKHRLLDPIYIRPDRGDDYLEQREKFSKERSFNEYVLNVGLILRYHLSEQWSTNAMVSSGPMSAELDTERLPKGFAFSNVFGLGCSYERQVIFIDLKLVYRHSSNANTKPLNDGHNSLGFETGISFKL